MLDNPNQRPTPTGFSGFNQARLFGQQTGNAPVVQRPLLATSARIICVASGKGGTGKSFVAATVAHQWAKLGKKVLLVDADFGLSDAHLYLGIKPERDISALFSGFINNDSVLLKGGSDLNYLYGGSGLSNLAKLSASQWEKVLKALAYFEQRHSHMIIDLGAGIGSQVLPYLVAADEVLLVTNPDPVALLDVFATIKVLQKNKFAGKIYLVVNKTNAPRAEKAANILQNASAKLNPPMPIHYLGSVSESLSLLTALKKRQPFLDLFPYDPAGLDIKKVAQKLLQIDLNGNGTAPHPRSSYFQRVKQESL